MAIPGGEVINIVAWDGCPNASPGGSIMLGWTLPGTGNGLLFYEERGTASSVSSPSPVLGKRPGASTPASTGTPAGVPGTAIEGCANLFFSEPKAVATRTGQISPTPVRFPMREPLKTLWDTVFHKHIDDILLDPSTNSGWVWLICTPDVGAPSSNANDLSPLNRLRLLMDCNFTTLCRFSPTHATRPLTSTDNFSISYPVT